MKVEKNIIFIKKYLTFLSDNFSLDNDKKDDIINNIVETVKLFSVTNDFEETDLEEIRTYFDNIVIGQNVQKEQLKNMKPGEYEIVTQKSNGEKEIKKVKINEDNSMKIINNKENGENNGR